MRHHFQCTAEIMDDVTEPSPRFLNTLSPSKRASALYQFSAHRKKYGEEETARRVAIVFDLNVETDPDDFKVSAEWRDKALGRILDTTTLADLEALTEAWECAPEAVLTEAIRAWGHVRPDPVLMESGVAI